MRRLLLLRSCEFRLFRKSSRSTARVIRRLRRTTRSAPHSPRLTAKLKRRAGHSMCQPSFFHLRRPFPPYALQN